MTTPTEPRDPSRFVPLSRILAAMSPGIRVGIDPAAWISGIAIDSRRVRPGDLFFCIPGTKVDGHGFAGDAATRGAVALVVEHSTGLGFPEICVPSTRRALGVAADAFFDDPSRTLALVGVTGTNGKTTTTYLIRSILRHAGVGAGLIGTVAIDRGDRTEPADQTTPDPVSIRSALAGMVRAGYRAAAMEVSSHALDQERTHGLEFRVGVFTNLTGDHLDYHPTMEDYRRAKARLFEGLGREATAVVNIDDPAGAFMAERTAARTITYGVRSKADVSASGIVPDARGTDFVLGIGGATHPVRLPLVGRHNVENALAAAGAALALGVDPARIADALARVEAPPGRLEAVTSGDGVTCLVDYAHTDGAMRNVLDAVRRVVPGRIITVFGCGGDRDRTKRPRMGRAAEVTSDITIVTSDNPRSEDPAAIVREILQGMTDPDRAVVELDRSRAIGLGVRLARPGDVVLVCGKGHEAYQIVGREKRPFSDVEEVRRALERREAAASQAA